MRYDSNKVTAQENACTYVFQSRGSTTTNARRRSIKASCACSRSIAEEKTRTKTKNEDEDEDEDEAEDAPCASELSAFRGTRKYVSRVSRDLCKHVATGTPVEPCPPQTVSFTQYLGLSHLKNERRGGECDREDHQCRGGIHHCTSGRAAESHT